MVYIFSLVGYLPGAAAEMNFVDNKWAEFFIKGLSFAVLYVVLSYFMLNKNDKQFFKKLVSKG